MLTIASLFSGVGGLELGLEAVGLGPVVSQVEIDPYCRAVLAKHWPLVRRFEDVRQTSAADLGGAQLYCGGFPCQNISRLGDGSGLDGESSGLWREFARLISEGRPEWVVIENVTGLIRNGLAVVLGNLAALGYDAWWDCIPAAAIGTAHQRDRLLVVARLAHTHRHILGAKRPSKNSSKVERRSVTREGQESADSGRTDLRTSWLANESGLDRLPHGVPARPYEALAMGEPPRTAPPHPKWRERHRAIGNAVVPQVAYVIGTAIRRIIETEASASK